MALKRNTNRRGEGLATRLEYVRGFILNYNLSLNLTDLRQAFEKKDHSGKARYTKIYPDFEAATQDLRETNEDGEYRLRVQLMNRSGLAFHLTPGLATTSGNDYSTNDYI